MVSIAFTGGGTGGHIYPGLAVAQVLRGRLGCRIFWIGSSRGMDREIVEGAGLEFFGIPAGKLRRSLSARNIADAFRVLAGCVAAFFIIRRERPALLFSKGGFVSVPPCAAAFFLKIPVFTHESDYSPGLATRINLRFARRVFTAFEETAAFFPAAFRGRALRTGNPVRREFFRADPARGRAFLGVPEGVPVLLVLGGSLGAAQINGLVRGCLEELTEDFFVAHQYGAGNGAGIGERERYRAWPFIREELPDVLAASSLVVCRAGAGTIQECASLGKPMILVPLGGGGTRGDQIENARYMEKAGAALVLSGDVLPGGLAAAVKKLKDDPEKLGAMGKRAAEKASGDAAEIIAGEIIDTIAGRHEKQ